MVLTIFVVDLKVSHSYGWNWMRGWSRKIINWTLVILFLGYYVSITYFPHTHHIENDAIIVHSHPFAPKSDSGSRGHSHSSAEFTLIHYLTEFISTPVSFFIIPAVIMIFLREAFRRPYRQFLPVAAPYSLQRLRAPPYSQTRTVLPEGWMVCFS